MTAFDPIKAKREELLGLADVHKLVLLRTRDAERRLAESEADFNALSKMESFVKGLVTDANTKLRALEAQQEAKQ